MIRILAVSAAGCFAVLALTSGRSTQTDWVLIDNPSDNTLHLEIATGNRCKSLDWIGVYQSPTVVNIEAYVKGINNNSDYCGEDILYVERHDVQLDQPLGDRRLEGCDPSSVNYFFRPADQDCRSIRGAGGSH